MKKCSIIQQLKIIVNRRCSSAGGSITSTTGAVTSLILMVILSICLSNSTSAIDGITLSVSNNILSLPMMLDSTNGTFSKTDNITVGVTYTGLGGYTLTIRSSNTDHPTELVDGSDSSKMINSLSNAVSESDFSADNATGAAYNNQWGYKPSKLNSTANTNYLPSPSLEGDIIEKTNTDGDGSTTNYTISLGARINTDTTPGNYTNTFVIAAVANNTCNPNAGGILEAYCMQDMNDSVANSMVVHKQYQLMDNRDGKMYYVAKMNDGRVWMTQNLDLDLETTPSQVAALTSNNTDLNIYNSGAYVDGYSCSNSSTTTNCTGEGEYFIWTPERATFNIETPTFINDNNNPDSYDNGNIYYYTDMEGNDTTYNSTMDCELAHDDGTCPHYHSGNYYNFSAVVASNNTANASSVSMGNSICPKGWRLPNVDNYGDVNQTWLAEGIIVSVVAEDYHGIYTINGYNKMSNMPLYITKGGVRLNQYDEGMPGLSYYRTNRVVGEYGYTFYATDKYPYPLTRYGGSWISRRLEIPTRCLAYQSNNGGSTVITFDKNYSPATGTMANQTIAAGSSSTLTNNTFIRQGYVFNGWNTASDGSGIHYDNSSTYYAAVGNTNTNVILYAEWVPAHTMTVNADSNISVQVSNNGGDTWITGPTSITVGEGMTVLLRAIDDTTGTVFNNWTKDSGVGEFTNTVWRNSNTKTTSFIIGQGDVTITANGTNNYTVISDGGTLATEDSAVTTTMQSITACPDWLTADTMYKLKDSRDNEVYYVSKLADGKCWLLDNLRLGSGNSSMTLTPSNTNITTNYNLPQNVWSFSDVSISQINAASKNDIVSIKYGDASNKVGTYYNYCAVSAGTICTSGDTYDATVDICPAGWRMPTSGNIDILTGHGEYQNIYNIDPYNFKRTLSLPLSGYYTSAKGGVDVSGYYWSSTFSGGNISYYANITSTSIIPSANSNSRNLGFPVRCLLAD